jgi:signal transduction histidine kinase
VENACRYAAASVTVKIGRAGGAVSYSVSDDGPGVRDDERERIFEPGVRGAAANGDGSGLEEWPAIEVDVTHPQLRGVEEPLCALVHSCSADVVVRQS